MQVRKLLALLGFKPKEPLIRLTHVEQARPHRVVVTVPKTKQTTTLAVAQEIALCVYRQVARCPLRVLDSRETEDTFLFHIEHLKS